VQREETGEQKEVHISEMRPYIARPKWMEPNGVLLEPDMNDERDAIEQTEIEIFDSQEEPVVPIPVEVITEEEREDSDSFDSLSNDSESESVEVEREAPIPAREDTRAETDQEIRSRRCRRDPLESVSRFCVQHHESIQT